MQFSVSICELLLIMYIVELLCIKHVHNQKIKKTLMKDRHYRKQTTHSECIDD